jgi:uncharacterized protein
MLIYYIIIGGTALLSWLVSSKLKTKFEFYSNLSLRNGMSGAEIAEKMLADHGIRDVQVISTPGSLTDHYNPSDKTVNLSESVFSMRNASAAAVAAHECGHAVQHATAYSMLQLRSKLVPVVNIASSLSQWVIFGGLALMAASSLGFYVAVAGLAMMSMAALFAFITLPVEYDASNRALAWLKNKNMLSQEEFAGAEDALKWAARTYVVAAIGALASLLYWAFRVFGRRD